MKEGGDPLGPSRPAEDPLSPPGPGQVKLALLDQTNTRPKGAEKQMAGNAWAPPSNGARQGGKGPLLNRKIRALFDNENKEERNPSLLGPSGATWDPLGPAGGALGQAGPVGDRSGPSGAVGAPLGPPGLGVR